jgi:DNA-binding MarR family transcriptional regulator
MTATNNITELARDLTKSIRELRTIMRQHIQVKLREYQFDISFELLEVLVFLWRQDGVNQQEIADFIIKDKSSTTYLIDNLVKRNLVLRAADENDRRNKLIFLTREGRQLQKKFNPLVDDMYEIATAGVPLGTMEKTIALLNKMNDNLKQSL